MWRFLIAGALLSAVFAVKLEKCLKKPLPLDFRSTTCDEKICSVSKSVPVGFEVDMKITNNTKYIFPSVLLIYDLPDGKIGEVPIEIDFKRGCNHLVSHSCPLNNGDLITWSFDWDFLPEDIFGVGVKFKGEINVIDEFVNPVACFRLKLIITE
ncbi:ML domain-containing protein [Sergentomyia squamirostris]